MSEWVSVKDKLPPDYERVLFWGTRGNMLAPDRKMHVGHYSELSRCYWTDGQTLTHVTHWQPLPEPPK